MGGAVPLDAARLHPPPFKRYVRFSRIRLSGGLQGQLALPWVVDCPEQPMQAVVPKPFPRPLRHLSGPKISPAPLHHPCVKPPIGVSVHLVEFATGIPGPKVIAPTSQHWIEVCEDNSHTLHSNPTPSAYLPHP